MNSEFESNEKTENPTLYRIKNEKKHGNVKHFSKELSSLVILFFNFLIISIFGKNIIFQFKNLFISNFIFDYSLFNNFNQIKKSLIVFFFSISIFFFYFQLVFYSL
ncbi:EscU/YscU/HrcU family type III secretion system export apparatus switch protein [Buchnera aphidicola (Mindarus keteleerifoliae)]|uniref:EscU/YscU/HrcU family type III secretion system export apparatus switch protein n=1 Tax=Buchnera aphidicola TaxID=9 RepID=UPI0031B67235